MPDVIPRLNAALSGRYRVERQLGEGGMATVYLADDVRHGRRVALKVLKPELAAVVGAERFLAEIRTTASLQHPHILPLFDSGEADELLFYVMPHVEGESLRDRLDRERQLPVDEAVRIATAVAQALDYAHRRGVIHRDVKPANVLMHDGQPMIADFGIALAVSAGGAARLTETGLSLGTPHYMSPEQATGDASVGAATDIYALGCVLYEMLVGEPPYTGSTPQAILGKIIMAKPVSATAERASVPPNVDAAIRKALEKMPADRFTSANELARALGDVAFRYAAPDDDVAARPTARGSWNWLSMGLAALAGAFALSTVWTILGSPEPEARSVARFDVTPRQDQRLAPAEDAVDFALSPDGSRIVYVGVAPGGGTQLWQRSLHELAAVPIPGTEGASGPVVSPDGLSAAFAMAGAIMTVSLEGAPALTVVAPTGGLSDAPAWGSDGRIYFARAGTIHRVPATGGAPEPWTALANGPQRYSDPLPDGRGLLLTVLGGYPALSRIVVVGPEGGEVREILAGTMARYAPPGHIVYATADGTLLAAPFDVRRLEVTGPSVALAQGIPVKPSSAAQFALSASGTLLHATGAGGARELVWVSRSGQVEAVDSTWVGDLAYPVLSPDGTRLAIAMAGETSTDVWVKQLDRGPSLKLTLEGTRSSYPAWTPDGRSVTFFSDVAGPSFDLWTKRADGSARAVLELDIETPLAESAWSPDGAWLVYRTDRGVAGGGDIMALRAGENTDPVPLVATAFAELAPTLSPDGRWMAYTSNETGREEIYVVSFPDVAATKIQVSTGGGTEPVWMRGGGELFYRSGQGDMVAVRVETEATFSAGPPTALFPATEYRADLNHRQYDVTADGQRFLMIRPMGGGVQSELILVQGFFEELRVRVGN